MLEKNQKEITPMIHKIMTMCREKNILFSIVSGGAINEHTTILCVGTLVPEVFVESDEGAVEKMQAFLATAEKYVNNDKEKGRVKKKADPNIFSNETPSGIIL